MPFANFGKQLVLNKSIQLQIQGSGSPFGKIKIILAKQKSLAKQKLPSQEAQNHVLRNTKTSSFSQQRSDGSKAPDTPPAVLTYQFAQICFCYHYRQAKRNKLLPFFHPRSFDFNQTTQPHFPQLTVIFTNPYFRDHQNLSKVELSWKNF